MGGKEDEKSKDTADGSAYTKLPENRCDEKAPAVEEETNVSCVSGARDNSETENRRSSASIDDDEDGRRAKRRKEKDDHIRKDDYGSHKKDDHILHNKSAFGTGSLKSNAAAVTTMQTFPMTGTVITTTASAATSTSAVAAATAMASTTTSSDNAENEDAFKCMGSPGPKVPPLKIVIPPVETEQINRNGKALARHHGGLPYVVASNDETSTTSSVSPSSPTTSQNSLVKDEDTATSSTVTANLSNEEQRIQQRVLRSTHSNRITASNVSGGSGNTLNNPSSSSSENANSLSNDNDNLANSADNGGVFPASSNVANTNNNNSNNTNNDNSISAANIRNVNSGGGVVGTNSGGISSNSGNINARESSSSGNNTVTNSESDGNNTFSNNTHVNNSNTSVAVTSTASSTSTNNSTTAGASGNVNDNVATVGICSNSANSGINSNTTNSGISSGNSNGGIANQNDSAGGSGGVPQHSGSSNDSETSGNTSPTVDLSPSHESTNSGGSLNKDDNNVAGAAAKSKVDSSNGFKGSGAKTDTSNATVGAGTGPAKVKPESGGGKTKSELEDDNSKSAGGGNGCETRATAAAASTIDSHNKDGAVPVVELHPRKRKLKSKQEINHATSDADHSIAFGSAPHPHEVPVTNCYQMFMDIRRQIDVRRKGLFPIQPKPPQGFKDYLMNRCTYTLAGNSIPRLKRRNAEPPEGIDERLKDLYQDQEVERYSLRMQHVVEKEKLVLSVEQEILRVHGRAARALANQALPFSACTILKDEEVYNVITPEQEEKDRNARSRYNGRLFISWLQDVDDKWEKIKEEMLARHHKEAESLNAVQKFNWDLKMRQLGLWKKQKMTPVDESHVPMISVSDDFDLLPE